MSYLLLLQLVTMKVTPMVCFEPCTVKIEVRVQRHPDNRKLELTIDGEEFRHAERDLEGEHAPFLWVFEQPRLPEGEYQINVIVHQLHKNAGTGMGFKVLASRNLKYKGKEHGQTP